MHVLLTNDDGIFAPGIRALGEAFAAAGHRVSVCAPDRERSASSHSVTLVQKLRARRAEFPGAADAWAASGTPVDCARLGLYLTREAPVDLVISGINRGMNLGGACVYSGTVGAALEAAMCGAQAMAVSLCTWQFGGEDREDYAPAARVALRVADWLRVHPLPRGAMLNLNVPTLPYGEIRGIEPATLAPVFLEKANYEVGEDEDGACYYYRNGEGLPMDDPRYDLVKIQNSYAVLTRLTWDFRLAADDSDIAGIEL